MARPLGETSRAALLLLRREPLTARQLAERLQVPERTVKDICYRLCVADHAQVIERRREGHARRPVAVYAPLRPSSFTLGSVWR